MGIWARMRSYFLSSLVLISTVWGQSCDDFKAGTCPLDENNIVGSNSGVDTPANCQILCKFNGAGACNFFTHFDTECYQLANCTSVERCEGCVSGPTEPPYDSCTQTTMASTEPSTVISTEASSTPVVTDPVTTTPPASTEPTSAPLPDCEVNMGSLCNSEGNLIEHIEHIHDVSDCQAICQNHANCEFWSHYLEEGHEHWGHCLLHYNCDSLDDRECHGPERPECPTIPSIVFDKFIRHMPLRNKQPRPGPGGPKCFCMSGTNTPDLDECSGDIPGVFPCIDQFFPGTECSFEPGNVISEMEGISMASDCQAICQNHADCNFFSHFLEEEGPEKRGWCTLHRNCDKFDPEECDRATCFAGPAYPDMDDCSYPDL